MIRYAMKKDAVSPLLRYNHIVHFALIFKFF